MAAGTAYILKDNPSNLKVVRMYNDTGAALSQYEPTVIGHRFAVCVEAGGIANGSKGAFAIGAMVLQSTNLKSGELTFGTKAADVYFDPSDKTFSDTETAGYYRVGQVDEVKDSDAMIQILTDETALLIGT